MKPTALLLIAAALVLGAQLAASEAKPVVYKLGPDGGRLPRPSLQIPSVPPGQRIAFALYTTQRGVLKMSAQCYPLQEGEPRELTLEVDDGGWKEVATAPIDANHNAVFRVAPWEMGRSLPYRVRLGGISSFSGTIRRDPVDKAVITVGLFSCNSNGDRRAKPDLIASVLHQDPDLLFFAGDQSYDEMDHLYAWLDWGRQFREILRDRPVVAIPDDHDIGQGNLWGEGGKVADGRDGRSGGYFFTADYVNEVQRAQTGNLPDPFDPTPIQRGISVYYTALNIGGLSCAIIEDRKWKTGPWIAEPAREALKASHPALMDGTSRPDPALLRRLDSEGAELLGERQLRFLRAWTDDWSQGAQMKAVLSQTVFAATAHIRKGRRGGPDLDTDGWPQSGRDQAVAALRQARAVHLCGDQHLGMVIRYGLADWDDAGHAFSGPPVVNYFTRSWEPLWEAERPLSGVLPRLGGFYDLLGNRITMLAYANPRVPMLQKEALGPDNATASGYGLVRFDLRRRRVTFENWPRFVDARRPEAKQFPGWPLTVTQEEQDGRRPDGHLPGVRLAGVLLPVVSVLRQADGELLYTMRAPGPDFRPPVFGQGPFILRVWDQDPARAVERRDLLPGEGVLDLQGP